MSYVFVWTITQSREEVFESVSHAITQDPPDPGVWNLQF